MTRAVAVALALVAGCGDVTTAMLASDGGPGAAGSSGGAGTSGGAGSGADGNSAPCYAAGDLLSDFTTSAVLAEIDNRHGAWRTYGDHAGGGVLQPPEGSTLPIATASEAGNPSCSSVGALHVRSTGFKGWGSGVMVPLAASIGETTRTPYNASRYRGVAFWARAAGQVRGVRVEAFDVYTSLPSTLSVDQACIYDASMPTRNCSPYGAAIGDGLIDSTWRRFEVKFAEMTQEAANPGQTSPGNVVDVSRLMAFVIRVGANQDWELWLDDVALVP